MDSTDESYLLTLEEAQSFCASEEDRLRRKQSPAAARLTHEEAQQQLFVAYQEIAGGATA